MQTFTLRSNITQIKSRTAPPVALVGDGDENRRRALVAALTGDGWDVRHTGSGFEMVSLLADGLLGIWCGGFPDVVLVHVDLPGYDGVHILNAVRQLGWPATRILLVDEDFQDSMAEPTLDSDTRVVRRFDEIRQPPATEVPDVGAA